LRNVKRQYEKGIYWCFSPACSCRDRNLYNGTRPGKHSQVSYGSCYKNGANKILGNNTGWQEWWPGNKTEGFEFNNTLYKPLLPARTSYQVVIAKGSDTFNSTLNIVTAEKDSIAFILE
jgi:hypothetical protein